MIRFEDILDTSPLSLKKLNDQLRALWNKTMNVGNKDILDNAVSEEKVEDGAITTNKIADAAITNAKIDNLSVTSAKIADASIGSAKIQDAAITNAKIADAAITNAKIANASIDSAKIQDGAITNAKIANASIDSAKIQDAAITTAKIQTGAITTALIGTGAIQTAQIADGSITDAKIVNLTANKITAGTIDTGQVTVQGTNGKLKIANNRLQVFDNQTTPVERVSVGDVNNDGSAYGLRVRGSDGVTVLYDQNGVYNEGITNGAITNPKISDGAVDNRVIAANAVTADKIVAGTITGDKIASRTITANNIATNTITAASGVIADAAITTAKIADAAITSAKIADATITNADIANATITGAKIANATIGTTNIQDAAITNAKISSLDAGKITTGTINANNVSIANDVVQINASGIRVNGGNYVITDKGLDTSLQQLPNLIPEHGFETVPVTGSVDATYRDYAIGDMRWNDWSKNGSPRLICMRLTHLLDMAALYGTNSLVSNSGNWLEVTVKCQPLTTYTLSGFAAGGYRSTAGIPKLFAEFYLPTWESISTTSKTFTAVSGQFNWNRYSFTFTTPDEAAYVRIVPYAASTAWVYWDGIQLVEGSRPVRYEPESELWNHATRYMPAHMIDKDTVTNGTYNIFSDGTMICRNAISLGTLDCTTQTAGAVYGGITRSVTFPKAFSSAPSVVANISSNGYLICQAMGVSSTGFGARIWANYSSTHSGVMFRYIAIGEVTI